MKINSDKIEEYGWLILSGIFIAGGIAFGFANSPLYFFKYFILSIIVLSGLYWWLSNHKRIDERVINLEKLLEESDNVIGSQEKIINEYEEILDDISLKIPCNCGDNVFDGIFKPTEKVVVECEKCNTKYEIELTPNVVLISEPLSDLNINDLIKNNTER